MFVAGSYEDAEDVKAEETPAEDEEGRSRGRCTECILAIQLKRLAQLKQHGLKGLKDWTAGPPKQTTDRCKYCNKFVCLGSIHHNKIEKHKCDDQREVLKSKQTEFRRQHSRLSRLEKLQAEVNEETSKTLTAATTTTTTTTAATTKVATKGAPMATKKLAITGKPDARTYDDVARQIQKTVEESSSDEGLFV